MADPTAAQIEAAAQVQPEPSGVGPGATIPPPWTLPPEWLEAEMYRRMAVARYNDTPGQILARVRHLLAVPWKDYRHA